MTPTATYKEYGNVDSDTTLNVYAKDLKTGDAPQTQIALGGTFFPVKGLFLTLNWRHYADFYADWTVESRLDPDDRAQSWKVPAYSVWDLHIGYTLPMKSSTGIELFGHVYNLFDNLFIQDAVDNSEYNAYMGPNGVNSHAASAAEVFMGLPRMFNAGIRITIQ